MVYLKHCGTQPEEREVLFNFWKKAQTLENTFFFFTWMMHGSPWGNKKALYDEQFLKVPPKR